MVVAEILRRRACRLDEQSELARILEARGGLDTTRDVDTPGTHELDRVAHVVRREPAGEEEPDPAGRAFRESPIEDLTRTGIGRVDQDHIGRTVDRGGERRVAGRESLNDETNALPHPLHFGARFAAVQLHRVQADA